jgi:RimJ/RimL family protein N-acetyltransferase
MLDYVYGHDETVAHFVAQLIPVMGGREFAPASKAIGVIDEDGRLIAGLVYHNWDERAGTIEMSGAALPGKYWLTRETLKRIYQYPFLQMGCQMVIMRVAEDNVVLRTLKQLGYAFVRIERLLGRNKDGIVCTLTFEAWSDNKINRKYRHCVVDVDPIEEAA